MRFIIMHKTDAHWESGAVPSRELIARVGALIGEVAKAGAFEGGEGLRASSEGVRLTLDGDRRAIARGPFTGGNELPAAFTILRTRTIDEAVEWAAQQAAALGTSEPIEIDVRPVNEPWDIGIAAKPANLETRRYMALRKATPASESGASLTAAQRSALSRVLADATRAGVHVASETMRPSSRGRRYINSRNGVTMFDGPFIESKELLGGYMIVSADSLEAACRWAERYLDVVDTPEVEVRELEEGTHGADRIAC